MFIATFHLHFDLFCFVIVGMIGGCRSESIIAHTSRKREIPSPGFLIHHTKTDPRKVPYNVVAAVFVP